MAPNRPSRWLLSLGQSFIVLGTLCVLLQPLSVSARSPHASLVVTARAASSTTTLTAGPNPSTEGAYLTLVANVSPLAATGQVAFYADATLLGSAPVVNGTAYLLKPIPAAGAYTLTATYEGDALYDSRSGTTTHNVVAPGLFTRYFAEGATSAFIHTDLGVFNPGPNAANILVTAFTEDGQALHLPFTLAATSGRSIDLNEAIGLHGGISLRVESTQPVAATRTMTWGEPVYGSTLEHGAAGPSTAWYFAEGATSAFNLYFLVQIPMRIRRRSR